MLQYLLRRLVATAALVAAAAAPTLAEAGDPVRGEQLYPSKCGGCHSLDENSTGPKHRGVFGRRAGTLPDYTYSLALEDRDFVWDEQTLDAWLIDPSAVVPGNLMGMAVRSAQDRADLIAYLKKNR
jgi:cytochrome c